MALLMYGVAPEDNDEVRESVALCYCRKLVLIRKWQPLPKKLLNVTMKI